MLPKITSAAEYAQRKKLRIIRFFIKITITLLLGFFSGIYLAKVTLFSSEGNDFISVFCGIMILAYVLAMDTHMCAKRKVNSIKILNYGLIAFLFTFLPTGLVFSIQQGNSKFYTITLCFYWTALLLVYLIHRKKLSEKAPKLGDFIPKE